MAVAPEKLEIVHYPAPILRRKAQPVPQVNDQVRAVARRMLELMHEAPGVGLAAPQVGLPWRLFVANDTGDPQDDRVFINPRLFDPTPEMEDHEEGCLSLPDVNAVIRRPKGISIEALDLEGQPFTLTSDQFVARVWQHEYDHLDGVLILDRMTPADKRANRRAIRAMEQG